MFKSVWEVEMNSDCPASKLSAVLLVFLLDCGGTLATRRVAIPYSSLNRVTVGVAAKDVPGCTKRVMNEVIKLIKWMSEAALWSCGFERMFEKRTRLALSG